MYSDRLLAKGVPPAAIEQQWNAALKDPNTESVWRNNQWLLFEYAGMERRRRRFTENVNEPSDSAA